MEDEYDVEKLLKRRTVDNEVCCQFNLCFIFFRSVNNMIKYIHNL